MDAEKLTAITEILRTDYPDVAEEEVDNYLNIEWSDTSTEEHNAWLEAAPALEIAQWAWTLCADTRRERRDARAEREQF